MSLLELNSFVLAVAIVFNAFVLAVAIVFNAFVLAVLFKLAATLAFERRMNGLMPI